MNGNLNGVLPIFKKEGFTSHDVVAKLRGILRTKKVGHTGTLDPNAIGVLPICVGKATKISDYLISGGKEYIAEVTFGIETDTEDIWGSIRKSCQKIPNKHDVQMILDKIKRKKISQVPPMYSAKKVNGKKLYEYAREGIEIERDPIEIEIYDAELLHFYGKKALIRVRCSKGTYIRTLIKDIGVALQTRATMSFLMRSMASEIRIEKSFSIDQVVKYIDYVEKILIPIPESLSFMERIDLPAVHYTQLLNGGKISTDLPHQEANLIYCKDEFIGIGEIRESEGRNIIKIKKLLH